MMYSCYNWNFFLSHPANEAVEFGTCYWHKGFIGYHIAKDSELTLLLSYS